MKAIRFTQQLSLMCVAFVTLMGCGDSGPKLVQVKGNVTVGGSEPFSDGLVIFAPKAGSKVLGGSGVTDDDGNFVVRHTSARMGIEPGEYDVRFSLFKQPNGTPLPDQTGEVNPKSPIELGGVQFVPLEYSSAASTKYPTKVTASGGSFSFDVPALKAQPKTTAKPAPVRRNDD